MTSNLVAKRERMMLRKLFEDVTKGTWGTDETYPHWVTSAQEHIQDVLGDEAKIMITECGGQPFDSPRPADAKWIATAKNCFLRLLDTIDYLEEKNRTQFNAVFAKLREELRLYAPPATINDGLSGILEAIDRLRQAAKEKQ